MAETRSERFDENRSLWERYLHIREEIRFEWSQIASRLGWLFAAQAFLFAALVEIQSKQTDSASVCQVSRFNTIFSILGILGNIVILLGVLAALDRITRLRILQADLAPRLALNHGLSPSPNLIHALGALPAIILPMGLLLAWFHLFGQQGIDHVHTWIAGANKVNLITTFLLIYFSLATGLIILFRPSQNPVTLRSLRLAGLLLVAVAVPGAIFFVPAPLLGIPLLHLMSGLLILGVAYALCGRHKTYRIVVLAGVAGSGKSTIGRFLAAALGWRYLEGDDCHPPENIEKMRQGLPLNDTDREPWITALSKEISKTLNSNESLILSCSALKRRHRDQLRGQADGIAFVFLSVARTVLKQRLESREGHFFGAALLDSQLQDLEPLLSCEKGIVVDGDAAPLDVTEAIRSQLGI